MGFWALPGDPLLSELDDPRPTPSLWKTLPDTAPALRAATYPWHFLLLGWAPFICEVKEGRKKLGAGEPLPPTEQAREGSSRAGLAHSAL